MRNPGRLLQTSCRLLDRLLDVGDAGHECAWDGYRQPARQRLRLRTIMHSHHGIQSGFWALAKRAPDLGLLASMGRIGDCYNNSMEPFRSRMQVELLDCHKWNIRIELANTRFKYLEIWQNRKRRHRQLGWHSAIKFERTASITVA